MAKRVLIAEDEPVMREVLFASIQKLGHVPILSPDGAHALKTLQTDRHVDLLVSDMQMPELDGRGLILAARQVPGYEKLPILLMSGVVGPKEVMDLLNHGVETFLPKPLSVTDLRAAVLAVLGEA